MTILIPLTIGVSDVIQTHGLFQQAATTGHAQHLQQRREGQLSIFRVAIYVDEKTIIMGLTKNRTLFNLHENPNAVFMIMEPGKALSEWKGVRIYVQMTDFSTVGEKLDQMKAKIAAHAGEAAAKVIYAALTFEVQEIRPLADFGQGWEKSI